MFWTISRKDGSGEKLTVNDQELHAACAKLSDEGLHPLNFEKAELTLESQSAEKAGKVDDAAAKRIAAQHAALKSAGFDVGDHKQAFATGTVMLDVGYRTQAARKMEHEARPRARASAEAFIREVQAEKRADRVVTARELADSLSVNGAITCCDGYAIGETAIRGLSARLESPMLGYVLGLRDRMVERKRAADAGKADANEAKTFNDRDRAEIATVLRHECLTRGGEALKLRMRDRGVKGKPDVFAIVSPEYAPADAPEAIGAILDDLPPELKGSYDYDPGSTSWELQLEAWTPTPVAMQAVGEPFRGYVSLRSRDNGTGRFRGGGGIELIRCWNATTYTADGAEVSRVHRGRVLYDVAAMLKGGIKAIEALTKAWGTNRAVEIPLPVKDDGTDKPVPIEQAIPGFWSWLLKDRRSELAGVLPGRNSEHAEKLTRAFFDERRDPSRLVRADLAQGWTRYIQDQPADVRLDAQAAIGRWVVSGSKVGFDARAIG